VPNAASDDDVYAGTGLSWSWYRTGVGGSSSREPCDGVPYRESCETAGGGAVSYEPEAIDNVLVVGVWNSEPRPELAVVYMDSRPVTPLSREVAVAYGWEVDNRDGEGLCVDVCTSGWYGLTVPSDVLGETPVIATEGTAPRDGVKNDPGTVPIVD
jgi:hypothetical protein